MTRETAPKGGSQILPARTTQGDLTSAARIYEAEIDGRLRSIGCIEVLVRRGEVGRAEADQFISKLATQADQWYRVYEAERELAR
jgi:hypothetical protein